MIVKNGYSINLGSIRRKSAQVNNPKRKINSTPTPPPPSAYFGRVLSLDAIPYDLIPNQIVFDNAGVSSVDGVYVYTQTGAPISGSTFGVETGFYGPVVNGYNNFIAFNYGPEFQAEFPTGFLLGDWSVSGIVYVNPANVSVKSFRVSGLTNVVDNGVYSRSNSLDTSFTKAGSNPIKYEEEHLGWKTWIPDLDENEVTTFKLSNSAEITTGGWERGFVDEIVFSGANNIANGTYIWQNQYVNEEENRIPVLTVLGSGGNNENRGWRIISNDDDQTDYLFLQSSPQTTWWNGNEQPSWYLLDEFDNPPQGLQTVMTSSDRGLTWTSPYPYQFNLGGLPAPHTAYNKTYTFTSAGSLILECEGEGYEEVNRIYYGDNMYYQANGNIWRLQFPYTDQNDDDTFHYVITLQKTGPSPIGTWTSVGDTACDTNREPLIIGGTIVGSNAIAISPGSGTLPTLSISEIEYLPFGEWQSTNTEYNPAPNAVYSHVWLDSISGFNNSGITYTGNKHVALVNNPTYSSDYSGVYSFNGVDQQHAMTQEVPQSTDGSISHFTWFKPTGAGVVVDELGQPGLEGAWHDTQLEVMQDGKVNFGIWGDYRTDSTFKIQSTGSIDFDRWYHLGLTYSSGVLSAYIDGEKIADSNCQRMNGPASLYYAICGGDSTNMGEGGFGKGSVGSFQVYNKGLTQTEVGNLYSGEKDRFPTIDDMFFPSLWLDASTGVNKFDYNYISQIVLSGDPSVTGTYNTSSIPTYNFEDDRLNDYSLGNINYSDDDGYRAYRIITENFDGADRGYQSSNGINWSAYNSYTSQLIITGFTGAYTNANGTYNFDNGNTVDPSFSNGLYQLYNNNLESINEDYSVVATKNNDGSFTPTNYINKVTISNAGLTSSNGVYTRTSENQNTFVDSNNLPKISRDGNYWILNGGYASQDLINWIDWEDGAIGTLPNGVIETVPKAMGDGRISSSVGSPNGSVTGTITTALLAEHVTSWEDQSENARNASSSSYIPSYVTIGGKSFVNFPANTNLVCPTIWDQSQFIGTIFCVARFTENIVNSFLVYHENDFKFLRDTSNTLNLTFDGNSVLTSSNTLNINTNYILGTTFSANAASLYYNGTLVGAASLGSIDGGYNLFIGGGDGSSNIAEVIIYNRVLDTSERQEVESYLSNKYDISLA